jgi:type I restriction-modification system DNA methylase subunit
MTKTQERIKQTGEVFTPHELCLQMVRDIPEKTLSDPTSTYLDPSCGDGNFLFALHQVLTEDYGQTSESVMDRLYGVELMADNVVIARARLPGAHIVCHDALTYDYSFS